MTAEQEEAEQPLQSIDLAWQRLQGAVEAHAAVGADGDGAWVRAGLTVVRKRAFAFLQAIEALVESVER